MLCQGMGGTEGRDHLKAIEPKGPLVPRMPCQGIGGNKGTDTLEGIESVPPLPARALGEQMAMMPPPLAFHWTAGKPLTLFSL